MNVFVILLLFILTFILVCLIISY